MAYDKHLSERIDRILKEKHIHYLSKKMMGGLCYMVDDKMLCGILSSKQDGSNLLMVRVGEEAVERENVNPYCSPMSFTGRTMKGYLFVNENGIDSEMDLEHWISLCLAFNPMAKSSKKSKKG